jgi:hypothetical protein
MELITQNLDIFQYIRINENVSFDIFEKKFPTCRRQKFKSIRKRLKDRERIINSFEVIQYTEGIRRSPKNAPSQPAAQAPPLSPSF